MKGKESGILSRMKMMSKVRREVRNLAAKVHETPELPKMVSLQSWGEEDKIETGGFLQKNM